MERALKNNTIHYLYVTIIVSLFLFAYADNLEWLWSRWMVNPNYSHGPLIPLISLFIVFQKRAALRNIQTRGSNRGLYVLLAAAFLFIISLRAQVSFTLSYSMILAIAGIVLYLHGQKMFASVAFPIFYLVFMVPFWVGAINKLGNILKLLSSILSFNILQFLGYPIYREGVMLHLANGSFEVADPCSGIRSLISLLALGTIMAYYSNGILCKKISLALIDVPLALLANTLRVVFFGLILETKGVLISEGFLHTLTGFGVFAFAFGGLMALKKSIRI
ncbi:MAG: exosortase/archaeosortase family protein [Candidatus Hodarchaeales archaeon]|jgi:exosortase